MIEITLPAEVWEHFFTATYEGAREERLLASINETKAMEGYQNLLIWATPFGAVPITIIRGET